MLRCCVTVLAEDICEYYGSSGTKSQDQVTHEMWNGSNGFLKMMEA